MLYCALIKLTEDRRLAIDSEKDVGVIAIDLYETFDSICHNLYYQQSCELVAVRTLPLDLHKRMYLPFPESYTELDAMGLKFSEWLPVRCGVPQGSLLGPLLFSIFIYDFNYSAGFFSLRLYADDTTQYAAHESLVVLESTLNQDITDEIDSVEITDNCPQLNCNQDPGNDTA